MATPLIGALAMAFGQAKLALSCQHDRIAASSSLLVDGWKAAGGEDARRRYVNSTDTGDRFGVIKEIDRARHRRTECLGQPRHREHHCSHHCFPLPCLTQRSHVEDPFSGGVPSLCWCAPNTLDPALLRSEVFSAHRRRLGSTRVCVRITQKHRPELSA